MVTQTALLLLDLQNEMVDPKGKVGGGGLAKIAEDRNRSLPMRPRRSRGHAQKTMQWSTCALDFGPTIRIA